jgi:hypothetical protein
MHTRAPSERLGAQVIKKYRGLAAEGEYIRRRLLIKGSVAPALEQNDDDVGRLHALRRIEPLALLECQRPLRIYLDCTQRPPLSRTAFMVLAAPSAGIFHAELLELAAREQINILADRPGGRPVNTHPARLQLPDGPSSDSADNDRFYVPPFDHAEGMAHAVRVMRVGIADDLRLTRPRIMHDEMGRGSEVPIRRSI